MRTIRRAVLPAGVLLAAFAAGPLFAQSAPAPDAAPSYPTFRMGGFTDLDFSASDAKSGDATSGFSEGQFVLHVTSELAPKVSFFGELSLTARPNNVFNPVVERSIIRWDGSDQLRLSLGRYHTPINWWNVAFHHGQWLQTSVARPEMTRFGGRFIPVHFLGALAEGQVPAGGMNLNYKVGVGNGRGQDVSSANDNFDTNNNRAVLVNAFVRPDALYDLQVGGAWYRDKVTLTDKRNFDEDIYSAFLAYTSETPEILAEYANVKHSPTDGDGSWKNSAWYFQVAYRLPFAEARWKPYMRYERMDIEETDPSTSAAAMVTIPIGPDRDPVLSPLADRKLGIAGIRWDFVDTACIKLEYRKERTEKADWIQSVWLQVAFAF